MAVVLEQSLKHKSSTVALNILMRNCAIATDHRTATALSSCSTLSARKAYNDFLAAFFSEPNILLEDTSEPNRAENRQAWEAVTHSGTLNDEALHVLLSHIINRHKQSWIASQTAHDLYEICKELSQDVVFALFLGLTDRNEPTYAQARDASENMLRGQFSVPVGLSFAGFATPYSKGLKAKRKLLPIIEKQLRAEACPYLQSVPSSGISQESLVSHTLMFSSSLVVKAFASLLTSSLLVAHQLGDVNLQNDETLNAFLLEVERLCPPIIGNMRRATCDIVVENLRIPKHWDVYLFFPLVNRDPAVYTDPDKFRLDRFKDPNASRPFSFGHGEKMCLGRDLVRRLLGAILKNLLAEGPLFTITLGLNSGVKHFLGFANDTSAADRNWDSIKQLPVTRPKDPILVRF